MVVRIVVIAAFAVLGALAQQTGPSLSIDANANRHAISPDVYGINWYWTLPDTTDPTYNAQAAAALAIRATARRWGGNNTSTYHWQYQVWNLDNDWYFEVFAPSQTFNQYADQVITTGGTIYGTVPALGWLPKAAKPFMCSYDVAKYGQQCSVDPYAQYYPITCGNGIVLSPTCSTNPVYISNNDPNDDYAQYDQTFQQQWIENLLTRYGPGNQGGVGIWSMDNEPIWWDSTHHDIHPNPYSYDELLNTDMTYAAAIKQADSTALVAGPVNDNWASLWYSKKDIQAGWNSGGSWYSDPVDYAAHGNTYLLPWYLQQFQQYEQQHGQRLLDYLDMHAYLAPSAIQDNPVNGVTPPESAAVQALRLESTREFWDPSYVVSGDYWMVDPTSGAPIATYYIPRVQQIIGDNYPGTKLAITEYNWYALDNMNGALAQADLLGIFGAQGLDLATLWLPSPAPPTMPGALAFQMYRNYDGIGGAFGETGVQAVSGDQSQLAVYAALRDDLNLTAVVINKTGGDLSSTLSLANFQAGASAQAWQYSGANLSTIVQQPNVAVSGNTLTPTFPANSITMLVIPPANYPVPKPVIAAVTDAGAYGTSIAPGEMVIVWGSNMGPAALAGLTVDPSTGLVSNSVADVTVLFDGIPAPVVYVSAIQIAVVTPYFGMANPTTHVQVEYQGVRSDPFPLTVAATAPALFTMNQKGTGQGAILNQDYNVNGSAHPAPRGQYVFIYGTGEGITDPPGVDGRLATTVEPKPLATPISVQIGGQNANINYAGAAPGFMPGLFQINAQVPQNVVPGNNVPVTVTIGTATSQAGVTLAVE